jgi:hypothetical protein
MHKLGDKLLTNACESYLNKREKLVEVLCRVWITYFFHNLVQIQFYVYSRVYPQPKCLIRLFISVAYQNNPHFLIGILPTSVFNFYLLLKSIISTHPIHSPSSILPKGLSI